MDLDDTEAEAVFRAEARAFLEANAPRRHRGGKAAVTLAERLAEAKRWQATKAAAGFAGITWPREWGGRGGTPIEQVIYHQEEETVAAPKGVFEIGLGMCLPTMIAYATPAQLARHVGPALRGEEIWCQMFSEPAGGSDLAGLRTRAERDGDAWVINGQKVWTSGAHFSDWGIVVVRTDPSVPKHAGLTMFFIDMRSPGIEVRPIHQMSGQSNFNEVFFTDVRVPDAQRLGAVGQGWKVALTTLMNERLAVGEAPKPDVEDVVTLCRNTKLNGRRALDDPAVRDRIATWYCQALGVKYGRYRMMTALSRGQSPGPEASVSRIVNATKLGEIAAFALDLMGEAGIVADADLMPEAEMFQQALMAAPGQRIAGGTSEILRNIIAERVLGLPPDLRTDKDLPFNQLRDDGRS